MRRALLIAAAMLPGLAHGQATATKGQLLERNNFISPLSYVNADQCAGNSSLSLEWFTDPLTSTFSVIGQYKIFASSNAPFTTGDNTNFCAEKDDTTNNIKANQVGDAVPVSGQLQDGTFSGLDAVTVAGQSCAEGKILWICAHWYDGNAARSGVASGKFVVQITAPNAPSGVAVDEGNTRLKVSWTANGTTPVATDHYIARAFLPGGTNPVATASTNGTTATISNLTNGQLYEIDVVAYSKGGNNPSAAAPSPRLTATPVETADFWQTYKDRGGQEQGGCSTGAGGLLALVGAASLLALRRRNP